MKKEDITEEILFDVANGFCIEGELVSALPYGEGHINVTYCVTTTARRYILQKMNTYVFKDPVGLMNNICFVTSYLEERGVETLHVVKTRDGKPMAEKYDDRWRMYDFIEHTVTFQSKIDAVILTKAGGAFGNFIGRLDGFDASTLIESIPHFHDTPKRYRDFTAALEADATGRADGCRDEIAFFTSHSDTYSKAVENLTSGKLPLRVTHNDTKLNNILMDEKTGDARAIIDLDTVMPGSMLYDFGDSIRFGASTAAEDEKDISLVHFSPELFEAYAKGFCASVRDCITPTEAELLAYGAYLMTAECGMRFLTDYLDGDKYFAVRYDGHNLVRARTQIRLAEEMLTAMPKLNKIIAKCLKG